MPPHPTRKGRPAGGPGRRNGDATSPLAPQATLSFLGTSALIHLAPAAPVAAVLYDGTPLPGEAWDVGDGGEVRVRCPSTAFDGGAHRLGLQWARPGAPAIDLPFRSHYQGRLDPADDTMISGWLVDTLRPDTPLTLDIAHGAESRRVVTRPRPAAEAEEPADHPGQFAIKLPPRPAEAVPELVTLTIEGTECQPFGPILRGATLPAAVAAATEAARLLGRSARARLYGTVVLPGLIRTWTEAAPPPALDLRGTQFLPRPAAPQVDVIVPVYRGAAETRACLDSLLDGGSRIRHRIVVIDDCSPEPELRAALQALADAGRIHLLRNEANLGFVASVNRGMALSEAADVLLLNADTVAPPGLLDRLYRAAHRDAAIATATPLSNNATILSLPAPPGQPHDPWQLAPAAIDAVCRDVNAGIVRDIPTAHGFCMFIKRAALDDVGLFDAAAFGTGYGEENDFSLRALLRGWRNVCVADIYVHHAGEVSFSAAEARAAQLAANLRTVQARHPFYAAFVADFLRTDPLHDVRNNVQKALWRRHGRIAVFVTLALDGGATRHSTDMMARLAEEGWLVLALANESEAEGPSRLILRRADRDEALRYPASVPAEAVLADILDLAPRLLHVQHVIDLPDGVAEFVRASGIPYAVTLHDFFYACPKVTLLDAGNQYCGMPAAARCTACVRQGPIHPQLHASLRPHAERGEAWRGKWAGFLADAAQVIAPSHDTATRYAQLFPGLSISVRPHFAPRGLNPAPATPAMATAKLRVALPGAIGPQKGVLALTQLAAHCSRWHDDIEFVVVGYSDRDEDLRRYGNIVTRGGYRPADAVTTLATSGSRVALLLNVFPETFSYTLSESLLAGLTPVAYDFGAIGERMRALDVGVTVPPGASPEELVAAIRTAATMPQAVPHDAVFGRYDALMRDYYAPALVDLVESVPAPHLPMILGPVRGLHPDGWCGGTVVLRLWSRQPLRRLALDLWVPEEGRFQSIEIECNGVSVTRQPIEDGGTRRILCAVPPGAARLLDVTCTFDFLFPLQAPDVRSCAAMLSAVRVDDGGGWLALDPPRPMPERSGAAARSNVRSD